MPEPAPASILAAATPADWIASAAGRWQEILLDHAYCEKKAASTALALIFAYPEQEQQNLALSRLAREELRHFEQVTRLMRRVGVPFTRLKPGRYAAGLRAAIRTHEPARRMDLMLTGALIEARSCERFICLAPHLPPAVGDFYADLARVEARHGELYLELAASAGPDWRIRLAQLAAVEADLATAPDSVLRFHSGPVRSSDISS